MCGPENSSGCEDIWWDDIWCEDMWLLEFLFNAGGIDIVDPA